MRQRRSSRDGHTSSATHAPPSAKALAVRLLARREYSREELRARLNARGVDVAVIGRVLDELATAGYLSDARCAQAVVAQRAGRFGRRAIAHALRARGIGKVEAEAALAPLAANDELSEAQALWRQRFGAVPDDQRERGRQVRFLLGRGYPMSVALRVLREAGAPALDEDTD